MVVEGQAALAPAQLWRTADLPPHPEVGRIPEMSAEERETLLEGIRAGGCSAFGRVAGGV
jgi:hypothetical protein